MSVWAKARWARVLKGVRQVHEEEAGQSTVEYLAVLLGTVAMLVALHAFVEAGERGAFSGLATEAVSHAVGGPAPVAAVADVYLF